MYGRRTESQCLGHGAKGQHELRKTIIRMLKDGKRGKEIAKELGLSEGHVSNVKKLYETGGAKVLKLVKRGRPVGKNRILTQEQEREIHHKGAVSQFSGRPHFSQFTSPPYSPFPPEACPRTAGTIETAGTKTPPLPPEPPVHRRSALPQWAFSAPFP